MQPTTLAQSNPRAMNDIGHPGQSPAPVNTPQTLTTNIVNNIPVHIPARQPVRPANEDDELDKIMRDVGQQLKQAERHTPKKRFFSFGHKAKPIAPAVRTDSIPASPVPAAVSMADVRPVNNHRAAAAKNLPAEPAKRARPPASVVLLTAAVTAALMAAAIYTYRLS